MLQCIAYGCYNNSSPEKTAKGISLHRLPLTNAHLLSLWKKQIHLKNPRLTATAQLCSTHFQESCFIATNPIRKSLGGSTKRLLKKDAVPTIFSFSSKPQKIRKASEKRSMEKANVEESLGREEEVKDLLKYNDILRRVKDSHTRLRNHL